MNVDLHAHLMVRAALEDLGRAHPDLAETVTELADGTFRVDYPGRPPMAPVPAGMFDPDARLAEMDGMGVDRQVVAVPPPQFHYHLPPGPAATFARVQNDAAVDVGSRYPDRIHVFATLPLQDPVAAVREVERVAAVPLVRGVQIGTNVAGVDLDATELRPVWAALEQADLPVWVHPDERDIAGADRLGPYYLVNLIGNPLETTIAIARIIFGGVLDRYPGLRFGFVHGGGFAPYQTGRWDHGWSRREEPKVEISTPPTGYVRRLFFDSLTHDPASLRLLGERVGWDHVVLGSDYPFDMASAQPVLAIDAAGVTDERRAAVLTDNAEAFLRPL